MSATHLDAGHPLLEALVGRHGFARVTTADADAFCNGEGVRLLVFTEDPARYRETLDLAVIVPELARTFPGRFTVGVLLAADARAVAVRFGFRRWPALVVLRDGGYVGAIDGLRNWDDYATSLAQLLEAPVAKLPGIGIAVTTATTPAAKR
jgi:hydrogenase-1 operon protein HyaE